MEPLTGQHIREMGNLVLEDIPEIPQLIKDRVQQYQHTRSASLADWLPDDKGIIISTRFGNTQQLHTVSEPGASRNQFTFFKEPLNNAQYCPSSDYDGFLFTKDIGGNEFAQIFWYDMNSRNARMLSDGNSVNYGVLWSNQGNRFAFTSTRRNQKDFDVYISEMKTPEKAELKIVRGGGYWTPADWAPNDSSLLITQYLSSTKSNSFILDIETKELKQLNDNKDEAVFLAKAWDKEGEHIYATTDEGMKFKTLIKYNVKSGKYQYLTDGIIWDITNFVTNSSRTKAAFTANENGFSALYIMNLENNDYKRVKELPFGQVYSMKFHPEKYELGFALNTPQTPGDVYSLDLNTNKLTKWTNSEVGGLNASSFPKPELIIYNSFDEVKGRKRKIPAFVYKPQNASGKLPVMISIHGGPESQHKPFFSSFYAMLANELGIAIVAPNVRGSSGYGKAFLKLDNGYKREDSVKDIGKLIEWIGEQEEFDKERIAVYGGSYGGYMVLSSMFHYNDQLRCGIDVVGISNFVTFLENTKAYRRDARRVEYGDERDPEMRRFLESISPTNHAEKIKKPLFVIQGANDPRVPASEAEQMVQYIRDNGGTVWYMLAKDEGHGFRKKENRDRMTEAIAMFLQQFLLD